MGFRTKGGSTINDGAPAISGSVLVDMKDHNVLSEMLRKHNQEWLVNKLRQTRHLLQIVIGV